MVATSGGLERVLGVPSSPQTGDISRNFSFLAGRGYFEKNLEKCTLGPSQAGIDNTGEIDEYCVLYVLYYIVCHIMYLFSHMVSK